MLMVKREDSVLERMSSLFIKKRRKKRGGDGI